MNNKIDEILKESVDFTILQGKKNMDFEVFSFLCYVLEHVERGKIEISIRTQSMLMFSALIHKKKINMMKSISKEYIEYLNNIIIDKYLNDVKSDIRNSDIVCLATCLSDNSFIKLSNVINNQKNVMKRKRAMHLLSFSEEKRCLQILKNVTPNGFVLIPAGKFVFGSSNSLDEKYKKDVWLPSYYISIYPVTKTAYDNGDISLLSDKNSIPCHGITWYSAYEFCTRYGLSLPTEAQWEKSMRGCDGRYYPWGNKFNKHAVNSFEGNIADFTPVGFFEGKGSSPYGVVDCVGNCWEWTSGIYDRYETEKFKCGVDDSVRGDRVLRGGAYDFDRYGVTCTNRYRCNPNNGWDTHGFRVVINI